ncbi:MAG TPA: hypothetical protein VH583_24320 [Vicinamibacterales bacterium]
MSLVALFLCGSVFAAGVVRAVAQEGPVVPLEQRARGAERVVVGRVATVTPAWRVNDFGDRLIVSTLRVQVDETLKGNAQSSADIEVEGGTIGELTLHVSDQQTLVPGDRAVFYLKRNARGVFVPHLRGQGVLRLDRSDRVPNSSLTLDEIRRTAAAGRVP